MKRKILILTSLVILISTLIIGGLTLFSYIYSDRLDYGVDEELFRAARGGGAVSYYAYDKIGNLSQVWCDNSYGGGNWCEIEEVSEYLKIGFISMEDREFYSHSGVNIKRTLYALFNHIFHLGTRFGASTITQQVVKNISGDNEFTLRRKVNEIFRAYHLENRHSKDDILELYLNIVPMPNNTYGVKDASLMFFGKEPDNLSLAEAALIVGVTNSPTRYNPYRNPDAALEKRNRVLYAMLDNGAINKEEYELALSESISLSPNTDRSISSWFIENAREDVLRDIMVKYSISLPSAGIMLRGGKVMLTMNPTVQSILEEYFENDNNLPYEHKQGLKYSMAVIDNSNGDLVAVIGNAGKKQGERLLNFAKVPITPASTLKPLALYAPMLDSGKINSATIFNDIPIYYNNTDNGLVGYPKNSPDVYDGEITLADAVAFSKNTVAGEIFNTLGEKSIRKTITQSYGFKLTENDNYLAPLALGQLSGGVSIIDLTRAYGAFANYGVIRNARSYLCALDRDGEVIVKSDKSESRIMKKDTAKIMTSLLSGVIERGTARSVTLSDTVDTAGKTGTSGGNLDKLFVGYTPYYTAGIWCGYSDGSTSVGKFYPSHLKIWDDIMKRVHYECVNDTEIKGFNTEGLLKLRFSSLTGEYTENTEDSLIGYFTKDNLPIGYISDKEEYEPVNEKR